MHLFGRPIASVTLPALAGLALSGLAFACGGGDLVLPNEGQPANVAMVSGDLQTGAILERAAAPLGGSAPDRCGGRAPGGETPGAADGGGDVDPASSVTDAGG